MAGAAVIRGGLSKSILWFIAVLLLCGAAFGLLAWQRYATFLQTPLNLPSDGYVLTVPAGATGLAVIRQINQLGFSDTAWQWRLLMRMEPAVIRAGEYALDGMMRPRDLLDKLSSGDVVQYRFTLVEGWTFEQMMEALSAQEALTKHDGDAQSGAWPAMISDLALEHPEGWFLPETYLYTRGDSVFELLTRAHQAMQDSLARAWASRSQDNPLKSPYEILILASIIEKETALDSERGQIAGVFSRRMKKGMRLQTDPTVIYGLGAAFDGNLRRRDLKADTPYNTYTRSGLPPTPIAMPSAESLMAAARPEPGETLYFVADGQGGHTFSVSLEEHQAAVDKLIGRN
jgi:UPF0755 protein